VSDERVLVIPTGRVVAELGGGRAWLGVRPMPPDALPTVIRAAGQFMPRSQAERDESWKQVIPYPVLRDRDQWFLMRRTRSGGDARLHDRYSIGVGGHMNPDDGGLDGDLERALRREWLEELAVEFVPEFHFVGLLNDDSTAVGRVHVGAVFEADAAGRPVKIRETDKLSGRFVDAAGVESVADELETWSRLAFEFLTSRATVG
jgi:predicted NUDIX family phosphoesterase